MRTNVATVPAVERENYLNAEYGISSWLFTKDHKRIGLLYLASITFFFFVGGFFALLIRLEPLTPAADLVQADTYNKLFSLHGQIMILFFLIPSIPTVLGNFLIPLMVGARDLAFPRALHLGIHWPVHDGRNDRTVSCGSGSGCSRDRYLFRGCSSSL